MKMKPKQSPKKTPKVTASIPRTTQRTFIVAAAAAYLVQATMMGYDTVKMLTSGYPFDPSLYLVYAIPIIFLPLLSFVVFYLCSNRESAKLWRAFFAALVSLLTLVVYGMLMSLNIVIFSEQLGYGSTAAAGNSVLFEAIPPITTAVIVIIASLLLKKRGMKVNDLSPAFQKTLLILIAALALIQSVLSTIGFNSGGVTDTTNSSALAAAFVSLALPVVVIGIMYLATAKTRTKLQRVFLAVVYVCIGVLIVTAVSELSYQIAFWTGSGMIDSPLMAIVPWVGLGVFLAVVIWHKLKKKF
jgi:hypothetical protein